MTLAGTISTLPEGQAAFEAIVHAMDRAREAGLIDSADPVLAAGQFLSATHGYVLLEMAGYFGPEGNGFAWIFGPLGLSLMVGLGASRDDADRAAVAALVSFGIS